MLPILALLLIPLSFSYAVAKHRALEIPVLLKRSARYLLVQRGFVLLILVLKIAVTLVFACALRLYFPAHERAGVPVGAGLGVILVEEPWCKAAWPAGLIELSFVAPMTHGKS